VRPAIGFLVFVEVLLLGGHAVRWARTSPRFTLEEVLLEGHRVLDVQDLLRLAALSPGMNIFEVDLEAVRRRIASNPWVRQVSVRRRLPHALHVEIEERRPAALLRREGAIGVDREGVVLGPLASMPGGCLPLLEGFGPERLRPGEAVRGPAFEAALAAASLFAGAPLIRRGCLSVRPVGGGQLRLRALEGRMELRVSEEGMASQAARFRAVALEILQEPTASAARVELDLTFPGRVVVRPIGQDGGARG